MRELWVNDEGRIEEQVTEGARMMTENENRNGSREYFPHQLGWTDEKISNLWNYYSGNKAHQKQYFSYQAGDIILNQIERYIQFDKMSAILDYGCGPGFLMEKLLNRLQGPQKCYGLDFSRESAGFVEEKYKGNPNYGTTVWVEKLPSPYEDRSMDLITALEVVEHLNDGQLSQMCQEGYRLLKPGGYVLLTTPNREDLEQSKTICPECGAIFHRWQHVRTWSAGSLSAYMKKSGFKTIGIHETNFAVKFQRLLKYVLKFFPQKQTALLYMGMKVT
ncbi:MAG: class I SAM-dependent methyltransferase [Desulfatiglandaceae bacterium]